MLRRLWVGGQESVAGSQGLGPGGQGSTQTLRQLWVIGWGLGISTDTEVALGWGLGVRGWRTR